MTDPVAAHGVSDTTNRSPGNGVTNNGFVADEELKKRNDLERMNSQNSQLSRELSLDESGNKVHLRHKVPQLNIENLDNVSRTSYIKSPGSQSSRGSNLVRRLSTFTAHKYAQHFTAQQKAQLEKFSSLSYQPSHSDLYISWLKNLSHQRFNWDRWLLLFISGVLIGLTATCLKQSLQFFDKLKWTTAKEYAEDGHLMETWLIVWGIASAYILVSSVLVVFIYPPATGSGVPEVISYLNGVVIHGVFSMKNLVVKFISLVFAVSSGIPCATQGPIIAFGALIGRGIGQFKSKACNFNPKWFARFRNSEDRRSFTTAGVAAGVAAGFNAPIGGLLFAMEDLSSFWSKSLCWQTFFCSAIAALVANVFNTAFNGYQYQGQFGLLSLSMTEPLQMHVLIILPAIVLGIVGGLLGALFTRLNTWIVGKRKQVLAKFKNPKLQGIVRCLETLLLVVIMVSTTVYLPEALGCTEGDRYPNETASIEDCGWTAGVTREKYSCPAVNDTEDMLYYSEVATLMQGSGTAFLNKLVTRGTHRWFGYETLAIILPIWYFMTIWTCGSAIAGGIFVPNLISGALYGRILGLALVDLYHYFNEEYQWDIPLGDKTWAWLDPGVMAVIGAGSLLGGVTRLTLAVTVIVVEMANAIDMTVPVLVAIWVAKIIADWLSKPLFKYQLDGKALPFLDHDPMVPIKGHIVNLDLFTSHHVMSSPVLMIKSTESVYMLSHILLQTSHSGFPVVKYDQETRSELAVGLITRLELYVLLCHEEVYNEERVGAVVCPGVDFEEISVDYISDQSAAKERIKMYSKFPLYHSIFINVEPFINRSVPKVDREFSLKRTYQQFHTMGMRHMLVTDKNNRVEGMITRKDLMPFNLTLKLEKLIDDELSEDTLSNYSGEIPNGTKHSRLKHDSIMEENEFDVESVRTVSDSNNNGGTGRTISPRRHNVYNASPVSNDTPM